MENRKPVINNSLLIAALLAILVLASSGCFRNRWMLYFDDSISGAVVDADSGEPIQGAVVVAQWELQNIIYQGFGGYAKIIVETSDKAGKFKIPFWVSYKPWKFYASVMEFEPTIIVYKPGYKLYHSTELYRKGDPTWPVKPEMTEEEKKKIVGDLYFDIRQYSVNPVRLRKGHTDEEIYKAFNEFESQAKFPYKYYSKKQIEDVLGALDRTVMQISEDNKKAKTKMIKDLYEYRKYWVEGIK